MARHGASAAGRRREGHSAWRELDGLLIAATTSIAVLGCLMVYSATRFGLGQQGLDPLSSAKRQGAFVALGVVVMAVTAVVDLRHVRTLAPVLYVGSLAMLVLVISPLGTEVKGAQSWFALGSFQLQPAELVKVSTIVAIAAYGAGRSDDMDARRLAGALAIAGLPMALVMLQPDLGTTLVYVAIAIGMLVVAGARGRHLAALAVVGVVATVGILQLDLLEPYQRDRLTAFATEGSSDRQGAAFQLSQSKLTIAAGGVLGAGVFEGTQTKLGFVPEQQTDFIFTVVGEELGFVGSATLLALYGVVAWRVWRSGVLARDRFGALVCTGVLAMVVFHVFQNMGMAMGIMPITGIPLPLMSYGGSATITAFLGVGLVLNVRFHRFD